MPPVARSHHHQRPLEIANTIMTRGIVTRKNSFKDESSSAAEDYGGDVGGDDLSIEESEPSIEDSDPFHDDDDEVDSLEDPSLEEDDDSFEEENRRRAAAPTPPPRLPPRTNSKKKEPPKKTNSNNGRHQHHKAPPPVPQPGGGGGGGRRKPLQRAMSESSGMNGMHSNRRRASVSNGVVPSPSPPSSQPPKLKSSRSDQMKSLRNGGHNNTHHQHQHNHGGGGRGGGRGGGPEGRRGGNRPVMGRAKSEYRMTSNRRDRSHSPSGRPAPARIKKHTRQHQHQKHQQRPPPPRGERSGHRRNTSFDDYYDDNGDDHYDDDDECYDDYNNHNDRQTWSREPSPSPPQPRKRDKRRSQIRSNPTSSVLQIQLAQAVERKKMLEEAELEDDSSQGSVSIDDDTNDNNGGIKIPMSTADKILAEAEKKRAMFQDAKNKKGGKSSRKVAAAALEDSMNWEDDHAIDIANAIAKGKGGGIGYLPEDVKILIEIVQGRNLLIADTTTSDPYVMVKLGDRDIHKTAKIMKTLNPHWTPESRSTFLLHCKSQELLAFGGLRFKIKDWDFIGGDDPMGDVFVEAQELVKGKGELVEYKVTPPKERFETDAGTLSIRYRKATKADYDSLKNKEKKNLFVPELDSSIPEKLSIMIEIMCARNLLIADTTTSDPYVLVRVGGQDIHKTSKIMKTLNPDWTPEHRSTFVLNCDAKTLFGYGGITFKVKDWDFIGGDDPLGHVYLSAKELCEEKVLKEFKIIPPKDRKEPDAGTLTLHYRKANEADELLLKDSDIVSWVTL